MCQNNQPTEQQLAKFAEINAMSETTFNRRCASYNNCALCPIAIHLSATKNRCTYGLSEMEFMLLMSTAECDY